MGNEFYASLKDLRRLTCGLKCASGYACGSGACGTPQSTHKVSEGKEQQRVE